MKAGLFGPVREPIVSAPRSGTCGLARAASEQCNSQKYASGLLLIRSFQQATTYDAEGRTADFSRITAFLFMASGGCGRLMSAADARVLFGRRAARERSRSMTR